MTRTIDRRAFTLVELLVALSLVFVLVAVLYRAVAVGCRTTRRAGGRALGFEQALLAFDVIAADVRGSFCYGVSASFSAEQCPVSIEQTDADGWGRVLVVERLRRLSDEDGPSATVAVETVRLFLTDDGEDGGRLARDVDGGGVAFPGIRLRSCAFKLVEGAAGDDGAAGRTVQFLCLRLVGEGDAGETAVPLVTLLDLETWNRRRCHPYWVEEPTVLAGCLPTP